MSHGFVPTMKPGSLRLDPNNDARFVGSDGHLEIDVPAGAITSSDVASVVGSSLTMNITEIAPPAGSNAGGGAVSLGSYTIEVVDGSGKAVGRFAHGLRKDVTLRFHYDTRDDTFDLAHAFVVFNGAHAQTLTGLGPYSSRAAVMDRGNHILETPLSADVTLNAPIPPVAPAEPTPGTTPASPTATSGAIATVTSGASGSTPVSQARAANSGLATYSTLAQQTPLTSFTFNTYPPVAKFGSPDPLNVDLNSGSLTEGIQLDVPPGPAGAMPNLTLAYNSGAVSEQHSPQGAAGWVGEGWSLSLGDISWAEHNVYAACTTSCSNSWQSQWELTDPFGTSTELIPPNLATATYYDDSNNWYCTTGNTTSTSCPIQFQTAHESYAKVYAYVGPNKPSGMPDPTPCFRVYLTNGVMEEFGCTTDSLQYYPVQASTLPHQGNTNLDYPVRWLLDLITNPQGDQVHITYQNDTETAPDGLTYPRDVVPATIEWDSPGCVNAKQMCTGTAWQPHYRVQFAATHHTVSRLTNSPSGCNPSTSARCDDPVDVAGGAKAPLVNGVFVLNDANVQVNNTSGGSYNSASWNTVRDYQFSYEQSGPTTITDPATGKQLSTAGYMDLTQLQEVGDDGSTASPATSFSYTSQTEYYEDGSYTPYSTTACGPSWNTGGNSGTCDLWSQTYDGNSRYLSSVSNGQGLQQAFTWANARNNTHGVNSGVGTDIANPLYCDTHQSNYPCNSADDQAWSRIVLTQRSDTVDQLTQAGQGGTQTNIPVTSTHAYTYQLSYPLTVQECGDCVAGMYWGNQNDGDYLDYYNGHFMGFAQASVSNPDGSVVVHKYEATEGWGVYDTSLITSCPSTLPPISTTCHAAPWWHVANAGHGLETEADYYDTNGTTLLKKTTAAYHAVCPPSGVSATPTYTLAGPTFGPWDGMQVSELDHNNPVAVCDVQQTQQVTTTTDGTANSTVETENYTYDSYGRRTQTQHISSSGGGSPTTIYDKTAYVWNDGLTLPPAQRTTADQSPSSSHSTWWSGAYLIDLPALQTVEDSSSSGTRSSCTYTNFDGLAFATGQTSGLSKGNVTEQDTYTSCGTSPSYTPSGKVAATASYDGFGNQTSTHDPDANSGDASHTGATGTTCAGNTTCTQYDPTTAAKATLSGNLANQTSTSSYGSNASSGFGLWPTSTTDANGQTTTYIYDALGRMLSMRAPGQSTGPATRSTTYANWCPTTGVSTPCVEVDSTKRLSSGSSVLTRQFFDGDSRVVETRSAAPGGQDAVQYMLYNAAGEPAASSVSYFVPAYTGPAGSAAYSIPDTSQAVTTMNYDGLGRMVQAIDSLSNTGHISYSIACNAPGTGDAACYEQTLSVDPNGHQAGDLSDGFGRSIYAQRYTGSSPATYAVYSTAKTAYDYVGRTVQVQQPDGHSTTTSSYDAAGRLTSVSDPDRGLMSYVYDSNGNVLQQIDARCGTSLPQTACSTGTIFTGYDGLNRPIWRNSNNTPSGAYINYAYDGSPSANGQGQLTAEVFRGSQGTSATPISGAYTYSYDALGRTVRTDQTMGGAGACPTSWTCQDIGAPAYTGTQSYAGDAIWTVQGSGADIWSTSDQFHYVSQAQTGDATLSAHVDAQTYTSSAAKAGLMVRAGTAANAPYYDVVVTPTANITVQYRDTAGGTAAILATIPSNLPVYIAIARTGTTYTAYSSRDGTNWTLIPGSSRTMASLGGTVQMGLAVSAHNNGSASTATFDSVSVTTGGANVCPTGWTCQDIGAPSPAGGQNYLGNGVWTVSGSGADIWGSSDQFHYVSQAQTGDAALSAHVDSQTNTNAAAKAGLMVRAGTAANAPYYDVMATPTGGITVQYRDTTSGAAAIQASTTGSAPAYIKVSRSGTTYTAYTSSDGINWTLIPSSSRTMANLSGTVQMGLAISSHSPGVLSTMTVDQITPNLPVPGTVVVTSMAVPSAITSYPIQTAYNDANMPTSLTYSDNEVASYGYDSGSGWLTSLSTTPSGGSATTLLGNIAYSGAGGAAGHATGADVAGGTYSYSASYDANVRLTALSLTNVSTSSVLFRSLPGYDAVGNVTAVSTTLASGTDNQAFCYDEQNRLIWAGAVGTPSCSSTAISPGSITTAQYTQTYAYDTLDRLTSGTLGTYTYGDSAHLHAATSIGSAYTAKYDAAGNMTCRAPGAATTCAGTPTGAQLTYDNEGRLVGWQDAPSSPTTTDAFLYDGEGNRVEQQVTVGGSITTSSTYVGGVEEIASNSSGSTLTKYFSASGLPTAMRVGTNGPLSYLAGDMQGSVTEALDSSGNATSQQLYSPYGVVRYTTGSSPTSYGYTGQQADTSTGLDFFHARYYDPVAGQFTSADTVADGLNRYGYVAGNPTTATDPTGHRICQGDDIACGAIGGTPSPTVTTNVDGGSSGSGGKPPTCTSDANCGAVKTQAYTCTLESKLSECADYISAVTVDNGLRNDALLPKHTWAYGLIIVGELVAFAADLAEAFAESGGVVSKLSKTLNLIVDGVNILTLAANIFTGLAPTIFTIVGAANAVAGVIKGAIGLFRNLGALAQYALDAGWNVAQGLLKGLPGLLESIATKLVGDNFWDLLSTGGHAVTAEGFELLSEWQGEQNMDIGAWCDQNPSVQCEVIPSNVVTLHLY